MRKVILHKANILTLVAMILFLLHILVIAPTHVHDDHQEHNDCSICFSALNQHAESHDFSQQLIICYCITFILFLAILRPATNSILSENCRAPPMIL